MQEHILIGQGVSATACDSMWKCICCGQTTLLDQVLNFMTCPKCGSIIATEDTPRKHNVLRTFVRKTTIDS